MAGSQFVEVVDVNTGYRQRVPREWLDDPVLGRFIEKTPSQRALDGELGQAPTEESTISEIRDFARVADIDVTGLSKKDDLLTAVRAAVGSDPLPVGVDAADVDVQAPDAATEPQSNEPPNPGPTSTDDTGSSANTPAAGD